MIMTDAADDEAILVCVRVADLIGAPAPRSQIIECHDCKKFVWIGPVEFALERQGTYYDAVLCTRCVLERGRQ